MYRTLRRKRMQRANRLQLAKHFIPMYTGKNLIIGYQKWFAVDFACAVKELKLLGVKLDDQYIRQVLDNQEKKMLLAKQHKIAKEKQQREDFFNYSYEHFAYIAGYTSGGFPYGTTWEEMEELELKNSSE
jgi:hypothetical protein